MGQCVSGDLKAKKRSKIIDQQLKEEQERLSKTHKVLLLGAGESGKSTIAKQLKILHSSGFSENERKFYRPIVFANTVQSMVAILRGMKQLEIDFGNPSTQDAALRFYVLIQSTIEGDWPTEMAAVVKRIWEDEGVQECFTRSREYLLNDSAVHFLNSLDRISEPDFVPTVDDVLRSRVKTTGISETCFFYKDTKYRLFDVGGQRTERGKWIHCFEDVSAVIFCVALSEYDMVLEEDSETNRMVESMNLFKDICHNRWFVNTTIILFLNKKDIFEQKIKKSPLKVHFPDYQGSTYEEASAFIHQKFKNLSQRQDDIYPFFTCATDTFDIETVFHCVTENIRRSYLSECGLL